MKDDFNYAMRRVICNGIIKTCDFCKEDSDRIQEGYCSKCCRPLWKKPGEPCNFILGYRDKDYHQVDKIHIKCNFCNTMTTI